MKRGRKPIPTALKLVRGNPGNRPLPENEPTPDAKAPTCPAFLTASAKAEWKRIAPELVALGLLSQIDRAALAGYCQCYGRWEKAERDLKRRGAIIKTRTGAQIQNPHLAIANKALRQMREFLVEFGMTPSARTRVTASPPAPSGKDKSRFFTAG